MSGFQALRPFQRYADFSGRSGRAEFWQWFAFMVVVNWLVAMMDDIGSTFENGPPVLWLIWQAAILVPHSAVTVRRLHDRDKSGWIYFANFALMLFAFTVILVGRWISDEGSSAGQTAMDTGLIFGVLWFASMVYLIVQLAKRGDEGPNQFGPPAADVSTERGASAGDVSIAVSSSAVSGDALSQLERLSRLHAAKALTDQEFAERKAALLQRM